MFSVFPYNIAILGTLIWKITSKSMFGWWKVVFQSPELGPIVKSEKLQTSQNKSKIQKLNEKTGGTSLCDVLGAVKDSLLRLRQCFRLKDLRGNFGHLGAETRREIDFPPLTIKSNSQTWWCLNLNLNLNLNWHWQCHCLNTIRMQ